MRKMLRGRKGFTLVEIMIALVLFAVGMLAFAGLEVLAIRNTTYSKDFGKANTYAQQLIEEKKGTSWSYVTEGSDTPEGRFTRTWTVTTDGDIKHLAVTVSWLDPSLGTKRVSFFTDMYSNPSMP